MAAVSGYGFEWGRICLERVTAAAGLRARFGEAPSGAPYATLRAGLAMTLQVAEDTLIVTAEIATDRDEPSDEDLARLDEVALRWPAGSLAWDRPTRMLLARAHLDAPEGRVPTGASLRQVIDELVAAAPALARLAAPPVARGSSITLPALAEVFSAARVPLVAIGDGVLGQRLRHPLAELGSFGFALGADVEAGAWIEGELLDGTRWPAGRAGALLLDEVRGAIGPGTIVRRNEGAVWRACYARIPEDPGWPHRAVAAAASAVRDLWLSARSGRFERRAPRPHPG